MLASLMMICFFILASLCFIIYTVKCMMVVKSFFLFFNMREIHGPQVMLCNQRERVGGMGIRASHVCETLIKTAAEAS